MPDPYLTAVPTQYPPITDKDTYPVPTFLDDLEIVDQSAIDQTGPQYIKGQWTNGEQKLKAAGGIAYTGGLLIDRDKYLPEFVKAAPGWADATHAFESGKSINAVTSARPVMAVIRMRFRWFISKGGEVSYYPRSAYRAGANMRGQLQALCGVKGFDFPVVFSFKGLASKHLDAAVKDFTAKVNDAIGRNVREIARGPAKYPRFAFWMSLIPGPHDKVGEKGAESVITPPVLALPEKLDNDWLNSNYVGRENLQAFQAHYHEAAAWAAQWDKAEQPTADPAPDDDLLGLADDLGAEVTEREFATQATFGAGNPKKRPSIYDAGL